ncbi:MAG: hypothetical protein ABIL58_09675 [Pseudomonadota bacterium]
MTRLSAVALAGVTAGLMLAAGMTTTAVADTPMTLVMTNCTVCHTTQRICNRLGELDGTGWQGIIQTMLAKRNEGLLSDDEKQAMADFLNQQPKGAPPVCP